ncbi:MAG: alpha-amylase family glycosyl hydrolase [bacterium]|nr:alpha-amylase family glycosyl hydrolase [bacterium]
MRTTLWMASVLAAACLAVKPAASWPAPADPARQVIYEVNLRQYTPEGTIAAFQEHLPRLRELGVDILWLMPIHPIGEERRKGGLGSPYSVRDYRDVNPDLGTREDLRRLVATAHALDMRVILDWVANHCAWDNPIVREHPQWLTRGEDGQPRPPVDDWSDVVDLDYERPDLRAWMIESLVFWLREADIDGYRCDVAGMVPTEFWEEARSRLEAVKPVFMLAEWDDPALAGPFDMSYAWDLHRAGNAYMKGEASVARLDSLVAGEAERWPAGHLQMRFTTNHDENSWNGTEDERLGLAADAFSVLCWTLPGMPLIYSGQEAGLSHRLSFFEKDEIPWRGHPRAALFAALNRLKHTSPALWRAEAGAESYRRLSRGPAWSFLRLDASQHLLCAVNLSADPLDLEVEDPLLTGSWREWEDGRLSELAGRLRLELPPWGWSIWRSTGER